MFEMVNDEREGFQKKKILVNFLSNCIICHLNAVDMFIAFINLEGE